MLKHLQAVYINPERASHAPFEKMFPLLILEICCSTELDTSRGVQSGNQAAASVQIMSKMGGRCQRKPPFDHIHWNSEIAITTFSRLGSFLIPPAIRMSRSNRSKMLSRPFSINCTNAPATLESSSSLPVDKQTSTARQTHSSAYSWSQRKRKG